MADQLSGLAIIICIALGVLTFVLLFIFAKRQIMRFSLKSRRGPHVPIAHDAPKALRQEMERRLDVTRDIVYEPKLLKKEEDELFADGADITHITPAHLYRMKAIDSWPLLESEIVNSDPSKTHHPGQDLLVYLLRLLNGGPLTTCDPRLVHQFVEAYNHARHEPGEFTSEQYNNYQELLNKLRQSVTSPVKSPYRNGSKTAFRTASSTGGTPSKVDHQQMSNGKVANVVTPSSSTTIMRRPTSSSSQKSGSAAATEPEDKETTFETSV